MIPNLTYNVFNRAHRGGVLHSIKLDPDIIPTEPSTVKENVKSVDGSKGAAERGFNATYADCIHRICEQVPEELRPWQTKVYVLYKSIVYYISKIYLQKQKIFECVFVF